MKTTNPLWQQLRAAISNAYYDARNTGRTMEQAADDATNEVAALIAAASEVEVTVLGQHCQVCYGDGWVLDADLNEAACPACDGTVTRTCDAEARLP